MRRWQLVISRCLATPQSADAQDLPECGEDESVHLVMMKGAPEVILGQCTKFAFNDEICDITEEFKESCQVKPLILIFDFFELRILIFYKNT